MQNDILILSSHSRPKLSAPLNHKIYAERHGYSYVFDCTPYPVVSPFDQKILSIVAAMKGRREEWIFWIDDDAYFMKLDQPLTEVIDRHSDANFIFCSSPINKSGQRTYINAGIFFVRNTAENAATLLRAIGHSGAMVADWWDEDRFGLYTRANSDQEKLVYEFETTGRFGADVIVLEHTAFNSREYNFTASSDQHFICHLAAAEPKYVQMKKMQDRFGLDQFLLPKEKNLVDAKAYRLSLFMDDQKPVPKPMVDRVLGRVRRVLRSGKTKAA